MKRMVSFSLALLMFLFVFAGCQSGKKPGPTPVDPQSETDSVLPEKTWEGRELKAIEKDTSVVESAIDADDVSTKISSEVYARNAAIEAKYNFTITTNRYSAERSPSESIVWNEAAAGESTYDIVVDASSYMKGCLSDFVFADLRALPYIKWTAPGWDQSSNDNLTVCGYQFVCTGDLNLREKAGASVIFCNRTMLEQYTTEDLRQTVLDHEWTMEKMKELSALVATKDSGTGEVTRYGLVNSSNNVFLNFMKSTYGMDICTKDENDVPSFTFDNSAYYEKTIGWIDDLLLLYSNPDYTYTQRYSGTKPNAMEDLFKNGKALFYGGELGDVLDFQENCSFTYTTFPYPIYNAETQHEYHAAYNYSTSTLIAIPTLAKDTAFAAFALQAMNERSSKLVQYFVEEKCKIRGSVDQTDYDLMTLAVSNGAYDLGTIINWGAVKTWIFMDRYADASGIQSIAVSGQNTFASLWAADKELAHEELNEYLKVFE